MGFNFWKYATFAIAGVILVGIGVLIGKVVNGQKDIAFRNDTNSLNIQNAELNRSSSNPSLVTKGSKPANMSNSTPKPVATAASNAATLDPQKNVSPQTETPMVGVSAALSEKLLRDKIQNESKGRIKLINFSKTNGQELNILGMSLYKVEYNGQIVFLEDCLWGNFRLILGQGYEWKGDFNIYESRLPSIMGMPPPETHETGIKGKTKDLKGNLLLEKTEKGWREATGL